MMHEEFQLALVAIFAALMLVSGLFFAEYRAARTFDERPAVASLNLGQPQT